MDLSTKVPTVWNQLAETMYLKDSDKAEVRLSELASFSFGRIRCSEGLADVAPPIKGELGYIVVLQLKAIPFLEQFLGKKKVSSGSYPVGAVSAINLQDRPGLLLPNPFDALVMYVTQAALDDAAYAHGVPRVEQLVWPYGEFDPVVLHMGRSLLCSLDHPQNTSKIFLDHVLQAMYCHFVCSYGGVKISTPRRRGGLSPWQMRRATELLEAHLDGNIALQKVADACELSVGHFARAFKETFHRPPHNWLMERRMDKARDLMMNSRQPIADIANLCGFADQSALNRIFKRVHGVTPGIWRRSRIRGNSVSALN